MTDSNPVEPRPKRPWQMAFEIGSTLVMIALAAVLVWQGVWRPTSPADALSPSLSSVIPSSPIPIDEDTSVGAVTARVALIEFSDFECPACIAFARDLKPAIIKEFVDTGIVKFAFKNLPLPIHSRAASAAEASLCAARQQRFWAMHDRLFSEPMRLEESDLHSAATEIGLDINSFTSCRTNREVVDEVQAARVYGREIGVRATPTFYFGLFESRSTVRVIETMTGARSIEAFREIVQRVSAKPSGLR